MLSRFTDFLRNVCGVTATEKVLLACSGGVDSMVLAHLLLEVGQPFELAHCNFMLRGEASEEDQMFVERWARSHAVPCRVKRFDTSRLKGEMGGSTQMVARELRYQWFAGILSEFHFRHLATAHHQDDSIETFFMNLLRQTGLAGLTGIAPAEGFKVRPLLFAQKSEILAFAHQQEIRWRDDQSNETDAYLRNRIRHKIIPLFEEENSEFRQSFAHTMHLLGKTEKNLNYLYEVFAKECQVADQLYSVEKIIALPHPEGLLHFLFYPLGFTRSQILDLCNALGSTETHFFEGPHHKLVLSRGTIQLSRERTTTYEAADLRELQELPFIRTASIGPPPENFEKDPKKGWFDLKQITFPLVFDHWKKGDRFEPLGMSGSKLVSDYFNDLKLDHHEKENQLIMRTGDRIAWIIGCRTDRRFRVTPETRQVLYVEML